MALRADDMKALFEIAIRDCQLVDRAVLVVLHDRPVSWRDDVDSKLVLPGEGPFSWRDAVEPEARDHANRHVDAYRVVFLNGDDASDRHVLGQIRWLLELSAQRERSVCVHDFGQFLVRALERTYAGTGLGSASVFHAIPTNRDANAAAERLCTRAFGPSSAAEYFAEHGNLLRPVGDPEPETLVPRLVVFASAHRREVEAAAADEGLSIDEMLAAMDPEAPLWWRRLGSDRALVRSSNEAQVLIPDSEAIANASPPIRAWWPLLARFAHYQDRALALIEPTP